MTKTDQYVRYYMGQQQGHGMPVFTGTPWMRGYGQVGFGLGGLFRSLARAVMPMVKSGAKALGKSALNAGANLLMDVSLGKDLKQAIKTRGKEAVSDARDKAINRLKTFAQTGSGKRAKKRPTSRTTKRRTTAKKRKASTSTARSSQSKKRRTTRAEDIFG